MVESIRGATQRNADDAFHNHVVTTVHDTIDKTTGMQTLLQMKALVNLVRTFKCVPEVQILDEFGYKKIYNDNYSMPIQDGQKVIVCKLLPNPSGMTSVAYPTDELKLPPWFKELPFDHDAMEAALIDKKLDNLLGVLKWNINEHKVNTSFEDLFSF